jgi:hypothetical protein
VDGAVGGCAGTGDGDVMMRFSPAFAAVLYMEMGRFYAVHIKYHVRILMLYI